MEKQKRKLCGALLVSRSFTRRAKLPSALTETGDAAAVKNCGKSRRGYICLIPKRDACFFCLFVFCNVTGVSETLFPYVCLRFSTVISSLRGTGCAFCVISK